MSGCRLANELIGNELNSAPVSAEARTNWDSHFEDEYAKCPLRDLINAAETDLRSWSACGGTECGECENKTRERIDFGGLLRMKKEERTRVSQEMSETLFEPTASGRKGARVMDGPGWEASVAP